MIKQTAAVLVALIGLSFGTAEAGKYGSFEGVVVTRWVPGEGRKMELVQPFAFISPSAVRWEAPAGSIIDGASIPQLAWSIIGGPFEGKYREASVIHDVACDSKSRPWQDTHRAFFDAMLANGVGVKKAKMMYAAVYYFGPRWERMVMMYAMGGIRETIKARARLEAGTMKHERFASRVITDQSEPGTAVLSAIYLPEKPVMTETQFLQLTAEIEARDLSLDAIEDYQRSGPVR